MPLTQHGYFYYLGCLSNDIAFSDDNDHNPIVARVCPKCNGQPKLIYERFRNGTAIDRCCSRCQGLGVVDEPGGYFSNDEPVQTVRPNSHDFLQCPACRIHFNYRDPKVWTGRRHICGQKIILDLSNTTTEP